MFFGDKYGEQVRVITMDPKYSMELCGGTHVADTAEIGMLKIISESSIAAGVRRIEAITGDGIDKFINDLNNRLTTKESEVEQLHNKLKQIEKELTSIKMNSLTESISEKISSINKDGIKIYVEKFSDFAIEDLRDLADNIRNKVGTNSVLLLIGMNDDKVHIVCAVTDDLKGKYPAGKLVAKAAQILGGNGGGKPHLATAGGKDIDKVDIIITDFEKIVNEF